MKAPFDEQTRHLVFQKCGGKCAYCGCDILETNFAIDHIEPVFRGSTDAELIKYNRIRGTNDIDNYYPSCKSCNSSKSTYTIEKWRAEIELKASRLERDSSQFRMLLRFGKVRINPKPIKFYFEKMK